MILGRSRLQKGDSKFSWISAAYFHSCSTFALIRWKSATSIGLQVCGEELDGENPLS